ncbi:MAG: hypothetical protein MI922_02755, partial [Bacteroidales bacterium]|nr:hypothetical protein [Bacteroidales bacterium]
MPTDCPDINPLQRDGTSRSQRVLKALDPSYAKIISLSEEDLISFAYDYALQIKFFNIYDDENADGNWQVFFQSIKDSKIADIESSTQNEPHLALFITFIKLLAYASETINKITGKHLDFYYNEVLKIDKNAAVEDKVHIIFELAKKAAPTEIKADSTLFNAGKDANGNKMYYKLNDTIIANQAQIKHLRSIYRDRTNNDDENTSDALHYASVANSSDGLGEAFEEENSSWKAFGSNQLSKAEVGFAISSKTLLLNEGYRTVVFDLYLTINDEDFEAPEASELASGIKIIFSGKHGWLESIYPTASADEENFNNSETSAFGEYTGTDENLKKATHHLRLVANVGNKAGSIYPYDDKVLLEGFDTTEPLAKILLTSDSELYPAFENAELLQSKVTVYAKGITELRVENDLGRLNAAKPFMPFGPSPVKGGNFHIYCDEAMEKTMNNFTLNIKWLDVPTDLKSHYAAYERSSIFNNSGNQYYVKDKKATANIITSFLTDFNNQAVDKNEANPLIAGDLKAYGYNPGSSTTSSETIVTGNSFFTANLHNKNTTTNNIPDDDTISLFVSDLIGDEDPGTVTLNSKNDRSFVDGYLKVSLNNDFLHKHFPFLYAIAMTGETTDAVIPNEPYTPLIEALTLDYVASSNTDTEHFHIGVFGQVKQNAEIKSKLSFLSVEQLKNSLVPTYKNEGEFYIGIENLEPLQSITLLFQVAEGSANPDASPDIPESLTWSILCNNYWKELDSTYLLSDSSNNLLTSGIVKLNIPRETTLDNSILEKDLIWIRAALSSESDAVCKLINVHAQVAVAEFYNQNNDLSHLETGIEGGTISKMIDRLATVKGVSQPYGSFNGKPEETDIAFYTRVSERLRHKQRAVTIWDYEHLILQEFPSVYKIKCL